MDNLNTPDNMSKNTQTKLFKSWFSGASGNDGLKCRKTAFMQVSAFILSNGSTLALFVWG